MHKNNLSILFLVKNTAFQSSPVTQSCLTLCDPLGCSTQASLLITNSWSLLKFMSIESVMPSNHLILCSPLLLLSSIFPSIRVFSSSSHQLAKALEFQLQHQCNEYSGLISFRIDWLDLLAVKPGKTLQSLLQHHSSKASVLWHSSFLCSSTLTSIHDYSLARWTFVSKGMPLLFNTVSRLVIAFLSRSKCLLISWLQSPPVVISEPEKRESVTVSIVSPSICHEMMGPDSCFSVTCFFL